APPRSLRSFPTRRSSDLIRELGSIDSRRLRELLPARVTNRGFPDFDLNEFLAPHEVGEKEIDQLFESALQLLDLSHPDEGLSVRSEEHTSELQSRFDIVC